MFKNIVVTALLCVAPILITPANAASPDWKAVGEALGKTGTEMPGGIYRVGDRRARSEQDSRGKR